MSISLRTARLLAPLAAFLGALSMHAHAKVVTQTIEYKHGDVVLEGLLAYDDAVKEKAPGVLIVHEWWGCNDYAKQRARDIAALGYVAFALDMYGKGVTATEAEEAKKLSGPFYQDTALLRGRAQAGLDVLAKSDKVDPKRIAAIGYCFGGTTVLQLALGGADLVGVVSFHGGLFQIPADTKSPIKARILVCHGADDPFIKKEDLDGFQDGLRKLKADWQLVSYGNAVHSFTNPGADGKIPGAQHNAAAETRSWAHMQTFLKECFASGK